MTAATPAHILKNIALVVLLAVLLAACARPTTDIVACPPIGLVADTERIVVRSSTNQPAELRLFDTRLKCRLHKKTGEIRPSYWLYGYARLLKPLPEDTSPGTVEQQIYGAIINPKKKILVREVKTVSLRLKPGESVPFRVKFRRHDYTPQGEEKSFAYTALGGFIMSPAQIRTNQRAARARTIPR